MASPAAADDRRWSDHQLIHGTDPGVQSGFSAYSAAKGAVEILTLYMAKELGSRGITANTIAPGAIETDFLGGAVRDMPAYNDAFAAMTTLGRVGVPDDIGPAVCSLLQPANRWITAQRIEVSGGPGDWLLHRITSPSYARSYRAQAAAVSAHGLVDK